MQPIRAWRFVEGQRRLITEYVKRTVGYKNIDKLKTTISPYYIRRTEKDVDISLPEIIIENFMIPLNQEQSKIYNELIEKTKQLQTPVLNKVKIQRAYDHAILINDKVDDSNKVDCVMELIELNSHRKCIIFSMWSDMILEIHKRMKEIPHSVIVGTGSKSKFDISIDDEAEFKKFKDNNNVLIATDAISRSQDFPFANVIINVDLPWNPATLRQRIMRCRRLSSTHRNIFVFNLISEGTLEEKVLKKIESKISLFEMIIGKGQEFDMIDEININDILWSD